MSENDENLFPWHSNPILQQLSTPVGLPSGEKTAKIGRVLFEQIGPEGVVKTGSRFWVTAKKRNFGKTKVGRHGNIPWKIKNRGSDWSSTAIAKPNVENLVKIRPVEAESKWLTEIVKKERNNNIVGLVYNYRKSIFGRKWVFYTTRIRFSYCI